VGAGPGNAPLGSAITITPARAMPSPMMFDPLQDVRVRSNCWKALEAGCSQNDAGVASSTMFPASPTGNETSADVYRLLSTIHGQLEGFETRRIGGLETSLQSISNHLARIEGQLHRIEHRIEQCVNQR